MGERDLFRAYSLPVIFFLNTVEGSKSPQRTTVTIDVGSYDTLGRTGIRGSTVGKRIMF